MCHYFSPYNVRLSKLYDVPVGFVPSPLLRLFIALFAVADGWLLLDIGGFVLFLMSYIFTSEDPETND